MAAPTIPNGKEQFFTTLYEGNGAGQRVGKFVPFTNNGTIANSLIFDAASNVSLTRTPSGAGNRKTFTVSVWVKRCILTDAAGNNTYGQRILNVGASGSSFFDIKWSGSGDTEGANRLHIREYSSSAEQIEYWTNRTFEDTSKWYHILLQVDTTQASSGDRIKLYVDGNQITSWYRSNAPSQDFDTLVNSTVLHNIGRFTGATSNNLSGYLAEFNLVDGSIVAPSTFGLTDTSTGRWIPKSLTGITYGTNGFRLQFLDSTHAGIDTSGNGNTFTASNLIDFESQPIAMGGTAFDTGSAGAWDGSYPVANGFTESTSTQAIYNDGSTAIGGVIGWDFGSGRSANIQHIKINQLAVNNSITGFTFEYSDNGSDYTSVGTFSVTAATSTQTVSVLNTAGKHRYWRLKSTTNTTGGQSSYRWVVAFLGFFSEPITTDSPTQNFPTVNISGPYIGSQQSAAQGNLKIVMTAGAGYPTVRVHKEIPQSGKWYWEVKAEKVGNIVGIQNAPYGVLDLNLIDANQLTVGNPFTRHIGGMGVEMYSGAIFTGLLTSAGKSATDFTIGSTSMGDNDYIVFAFDMDNGKAWWGWNDSSAGSSVVWFANDGGTDGNPSTGANPTVTFNPRDHRFVPAQGGFAPGSSDGAGGTYASNFIYNFGSKAFAFTAPTGFSALSQNNFPETDKGVSGLNWIKDRDNASYYHTLQDSSRGPNKELYSNDTAQQASTTDSVTKFLKGGVAVEDAVNVNNSGDSFVSWNWVANSGTTSSNTDGSITSTVQANTAAGFSILEYTGTGSSGSIGHGLSAAPEVIWIKDKGNSTNWRCWHHKFGNITTYQKLNSDDGYGSASMWGTPTASAIIVGGTGYEVNESSNNYIAYCWHGVEGFSKFGRYSGNNNNDGTFIYTGFKPAFVMMKGYTIGTPWIVWDNKRSTFNPSDNVLYPNITDAEATSGNDLDILSNGFKCRGTAQDFNSTYDYLYFAWAEHPFVGDGTSPVTAR